MSLKLPEEGKSAIAKTYKEVAERNRLKMPLISHSIHFLLPLQPNAT
jgi:hypothetical protein